MLFKKLTVSFVLSLSIIFNMNILYALSVIPGGDSIGINLEYEGIVITGGYSITVDEKPYNPMEEGIEVGDVIFEANGKPVQTIAELMDEIKDCLLDDNVMNLSLKRGETVVQQDIKMMHDKETSQFSTGLYVKDCLMGVGTMTYYNPETNSFGSLGHAMSDVELDDRALIKTGTIYRSTVTGIKKGSENQAGQKIATINDVELGEVNDHSQFGIYGTYDNSAIDTRDLIETAKISEVKLGKAYFLTVLEGDEIVECEIEITELAPQSEIDQKGITFTITDQEVIRKSNGIVQGMSGSPIIQDGKLIGCVTHVSSTNQNIGYGLYIEWMLEMDEQE
ncbi:MAG: SpoIVB peptidase S55 domain-containing protein [Coprobacillaceae bacterium]